VIRGIPDVERVDLEGELRESHNPDENLKRKPVVGDRRPQRGGRGGRAFDLSARKYIMHAFKVIPIFQRGKGSQTGRCNDL